VRTPQATQTYTEFLKDVGTDTFFTGLVNIFVKLLKINYRFMFIHVIILLNNMIVEMTV